ncbi:MAG TPA: DUF448 domain-containing protein [Myxococcota bacterium]|nr:DUF448 domain-containing protein [Myxococcota bacterium]
MDTIRTCLACRHKAKKLELCRFVRAKDGEICFDIKGDLPHRGAWVCAKKSCLFRAFNKKLLFRREKTLPIDQEVMLSHITETVKKSALSTLGLIKRQGKLEAGRDAVCRTLALGRAMVLILAKDVSKRSERELTQLALRSNTVSTVETSFVMEELGQCLGRKKTGVVALMESRITNELLSRIDKLKGLES